MPHNESFLPRYALDTPHVVFPAVNARESAYRTVRLTNTGTTPILFNFESDTTGWVHLGTRRQRVIMGYKN